MKHNIGLQRVDGHRSHISSRGVGRFLQRIGFQEYWDKKLEDWLTNYKSKKK